ncbi:hypothetical protein BH20GEM2_BH20GEM2_09180 [soil metagenome]
MGERRSLLADLGRGALAGAAATWVMGQTTTYLYEHESRQAREMEDEARGNKTAYGVAAEKGAGMFGRDLPDEERQRVGLGIHWALGVGMGALYGVIRGRMPAADAAQGMLFGTVFFGLLDEVATPALGLTPGPTAFPWQTHARGLAGHLVFGLVAETTLQLADRIG